MKRMGLLFTIFFCALSAAFSVKAADTEVVSNSGTSNVDVSMDVPSTFSVLIPKKIVLDGATGSATYQIGIKGDIDTDERVRVAPSDTMLLTHESKPSLQANVSQMRTIWTYDDLMLTNVYDYTSGTISVSGKTAGTYTGTLMFNISLMREDGTIVDEGTGSGAGGSGSGSSEVIIEGSELAPGVYDRYDVLLASWDEAGIDVEQDYNYVSSTVGAAYYALENDSRFATARKIVLPDTITKIGNNAFAGCARLLSVAMPEGIQSIGNNAFAGCSIMTKAKVPAGVTSIGLEAFRDCTSLLAISLPEGLESIGGSAFYNCKGLTNVVIPETVTSVGSYTFYSCTGLVSVTIPSSITAISANMFTGCTSLTTVINPGSIQSIGDSAFYNCSAMTSFRIWDGTKTVGERAFYGCTILESVTISDNVRSIGRQAFYLCKSLKEITIPDSVTSMGNECFASCYSLTSIEIPKSITTNNFTSWFSDCLALANIKVAEDSTVFTSRDADGDECNVIINKSTNQLLLGAANSVIPNGVASIGSDAFRNRKGLISVTIPGSVTAIGYSAFYGCTSLTSITIPDSVTAIGNNAFEGCTGLTNVTIPDSVTTIGSSAFYDCTSLTSVTIPDSVTVIEGCAFSHCTSLKSIKLPDGIQKLPDQQYVSNSGPFAYSGLENVVYKGKTYTSKSELTAALTNNGVTLGSYTFYKTSLAN